LLIILFLLIEVAPHKQSFLNSDTAKAVRIIFQLEQRIFNRLIVLAFATVIGKKPTTSVLISTALAVCHAVKPSQSSGKIPVFVFLRRHLVLRLSMALMCGNAQIRIGTLEIFRKSHTILCMLRNFHRRIGMSQLRRSEIALVGVLQIFGFFPRIIRHAAQIHVRLCHIIKDFRRIFLRLVFTQ
jgi:hypothetical protein